MTIYGDIRREWDYSGWRCFLILNVIETRRERFYTLPLKNVFNKKLLNQDEISEIKINKRGINVSI